MRWTGGVFLLFAAAAALAPFAPSAAAIAEGAPVERVLEARGPLGPLKGTLLSPSRGAAPVVLIIPGSGPTDRNGDSPLGVKASTYRLLAEALAARGVASVRIDKRGLFASAGAVSDPNDVTIRDYAEDVQAWVDAIRHATGAPCVYLFGHSEGGLVALFAATRTRPLCGLVLAAAPGRPFGALLREQLRANPANAPLLPEADAAIASLEAGRRVDAAALPAPLRPLFAPQVQGFLIDLMSLDPRTLIAAYRGPVLILQGERDLQVTVLDAQELKAADPRAALVALPGINHVLKFVGSDDRRANLATYADPSLPLGPGVAEAVAGFVSGSP